MGLWPEEERGASLGRRERGREICLLAYLGDLLCFCCPQNATLAAAEVGMGTGKGEHCQGKVLAYEEGGGSSTRCWLLPSYFPLGCPASGASAERLVSPGHGPV